MGSTIKILFIKNTLIDSVEIMNVLNNSGIPFEIISIDFADDPISKIGVIAPDVILFEHQPQLSNPADTYISLKTAGIDIPFILLTGPNDEKIALSLLKSGADDYLIRDQPGRLPFAIKSAVERQALKVAANLELAETALIQGLINLSAIIENTTDLVYSLDRQLNFIAFNQLFKNTIAHVYGFDVRQGANIMKMLWEYDGSMAQKWSDIYDKALNGDAVQFVNEYDNEGSKIHLSYSLNPIWEDGVVTGLSCFSRDITRQKMDEFALKKSEASLRTVLDNADLAYILIDDELKLLTVNERAQKYSVEQNGIKLVEGTPILGYFDSSRQPVILDILKRAKDGEIVSYQLNLQNAGQEKWFDITWAGIKNTEQESIGYLLTNREITEKKKSEIEREKITADLIKRNKDLEQFTYIISHNLRAPLANIMGLSNLLSDLVPEEIECLEIVGGITMSANKLDDVISDLNQILQVSYLSEKNEQVILSALLEDIKRSIFYLIKKERAKLTYDFAAVDSLFTLKSYLLSIFYNLIMNSIKYRRPEVDPEINIVSKIENNKIVINYRDNGRGIDIEKNKADLFGLYKRFDTSVEGKGMGLFMIKMQIESLGGKITLDSELNKGTQFELEFPLSQLYQSNTKTD